MSAGSSPTVATSAVVSRRHQAFSLAAAALRIASLRIDYNTLECAFLITSVMVLMTGMLFASHGFPVGSVGYLLLNIVAAAFIVGSTLVFLLLLGFEVYRSIKFAAVHEVARQVEEEAVEAAMLERARGPRSARGEALVPKQRRRSSLAARFMGRLGPGASRANAGTRPSGGTGGAHAVSVEVHTVSAASQVANPQARWSRVLSMNRTGTPAPTPLWGR